MNPVDLRTRQSLSTDTRFKASCSAKSDPTSFIKTLIRYHNHVPRPYDYESAANHLVQMIDSAAGFEVLTKVMEAYQHHWVRHVLQPWEAPVLPPLSVIAAMERKLNGTPYVIPKASSRQRYGDVLTMYLIQSYNPAYQHYNCYKSPRDLAAYCVQEAKQDPRYQRPNMIRMALDRLEALVTPGTPDSRDGMKDSLFRRTYAAPGTSPYEEAEYQAVVQTFFKAYLESTLSDN